MSTELCVWCCEPKHSGGCDREALKEQIRLLRLEVVAARPAGPDVLLVTSLISHRNQTPRIDIQIHGLHTQMPVDAAVDFAKNILEVAAGSYADGFIVHFLQEKTGLPPEKAVRILVDFRDFRMALAEKFKRDQEGQ
jgi:hypothetical protein